MVLSMLAVSVFKKLTEQNFKLLTIQRVQYFTNTIYFFILTHH